MNMLRAVTGGFAVMAMVGTAACAASDESNEGAASDCPTQPASSPASPTAAAASGDSGTRLASLVEACEGYFASRGTTGGLGNVWLHLTPEGCMIGTERVLLPDGTVKMVGPEADLAMWRGGTWKGDSFYFEVVHPNGANANGGDDAGGRAIRYDFDRITGYER